MDATKVRRASSAVSEAACFVVRVCPAVSAPAFFYGLMKQVVRQGGFAIPGRRNDNGARRTLGQQTVCFDATLVLVPPARRTVRLMEALYLEVRFSSAVSYGP